MSNLVSDFRHAFRALRRTPFFSLFAVLTIALGLGVNAAIFSVARAVLLRPLPYQEPDRLVMLWGELQARDRPYWPHSTIDFGLYRERADLFESLAGVFTFTQPMTGEGDPIQVSVGGVTDGFFELLGVTPALGRGFLLEDALPPPPDAAPEDIPPPVVLLSHGFWQRKFGGDPEVLDRTIYVAGQPAMVAGVLPEGFQLLMPTEARLASEVDMWTAIRFNFAVGNRRNVVLRVIGRLNPGVTVQQAQQQMDAIADQFREEDSIYITTGFKLHVIPYIEDVTRNAGSVIWALMGAVAFVLLIACANVSSLVLVRSMTREREVAVRAAMGAGRWQIVRQMLVESLMVATAGGIVGLLLAQGSIRLLLALQPPELPRIDTVSIDTTVLLFTAVATLVSVLIFGLVPALQSSQLDLAGSLRDRGRTTATRMHRLLRRGIVVTEVALSMVLLIGTGLMLRSFQELQTLDPGYDASNVLTFDITLPGARYPGPEPRAAFMDQLVERLEASPEIETVSAALTMPLDGRQAFGGRFGPPEASEDESLYGYADYRVVTEGFFETLRTPTIAGRTFETAEIASDQSIVVIDRLLAESLWPGESAIGKQFLTRARGAEPDMVEVIGVVEHQRHPSVARQGFGTVFFTNGFMGVLGNMTWAVRSSIDPLMVVDRVRSEVAELDPLIPLDRIRPMQDYVDESAAPTVFSLILVGIFGSVALILAAIGLYGVLSFTVRQRTSELGVRVACGAGPGRILKLIVGHGMVLAGLGILLGVVAAFLLTRFMESMLVGVAPTDPSTFVIIAVLFGAVAGIASLLPALRAMRIDPIAALRAE